jgi:hypothetical protein
VLWPLNTLCHEYEYQSWVYFAASNLTRLAEIVTWDRSISVMFTWLVGIFQSFHPGCLCPEYSEW